MSKNLIQIDVSDSKNETDDDLIKIKINNGEFLEVSFSKLFNRSKYIRDRYKYSEALILIPTEIEEIKRKFNIKEESIKFFIELVEEEKVKIPSENYKDIYTLSEYFNIQRFITKLSNLKEKIIFNDINFTIQQLLESKTTNNDIEMKFIIKIENFLSERINEIIQNTKFKELPISTISRIIEKSYEKLDHNLLLEFILESTETRFILFKFIEIDRMRKEKINEMINFIDKQEENKKQKYLEYIRFNHSFIKRIINEYQTLFKENTRIKYELEEETKKHEQTKEELQQIKEKMNQIIGKLKEEEINHKHTKDELEEEIMKHEQTKEELQQIKEKMNQIIDKLKEEEINHKHTKDKLEEEKISHEQTKEEHERTKEKMYQAIEKLKQEEINHGQTEKELEQFKNLYKEELTQIKNEKIQSIQVVKVCGCNEYNRLGEKSNNEAINGKPIISPPITLAFDSSSILSYSVYGSHALMITSDLSLKGLGNNNTCRITSLLPKADIDHFIEFSIKDGSGKKLDPISAVCCNYSTLYMFSNNSGSGRQLVFCDEDINGGDPVFLDIGNQNPVSLFGGFSHSAAICSEGEVIFINRDSVKISPKSLITAFSLPNNEKASSVACCDDSVFVLSSKGRVFYSPVEEGSNVLKFSEVEELKGSEIVCVSGTNDHCLAVSKEGRVFGRGSNNFGKLGLGKKIESKSTFTEISSLEEYEIRSASAGFSHSLFETRDSKILACGYNANGELLLSSGPGESVYLPTETTITGGSTFCIAGGNFSAVFIGSNPPPNMPNIRITKI